MSGAGVLYVFAKAPRPGLVKTRLARTIGPDAACAWYESTLRGVLERLDGTGPWRTVMAVTPDESVGEAALWPGPTPRVAQGPGDLGARMGRFLAQATPMQPVVIVGSDIPDLHARHITAAFAALAAHDLVFGPAEDGGYWLIGASAPLPTGIFTGVRWSSEHALADTLGNARTRRVALLEDRLEDVDDADSYRRFIERTRDQP